MLRLQWSEEHEHFVSSKKCCFCSVCFQKSLCRCNNLWSLPTNALRKLKKDASRYEICVFAFFIRNMSGNASCTKNMSVSDCHGNHENIAFFIGNMSGNAPCTNNMSVSDCHGNHEHIEYFIGFIDNRDG